MVITGNASENIYKVFPSTAMVIGFQYKGQLSSITNNSENKLSPMGITGIGDSVKIFRNTAGIGTILVYFTETGFAHFSTSPAHELFNQSVSLDDLFEQENIRILDEILALAITDAERIKAVETFLVSQLKEKSVDQLIIRAVQFIYHSKGDIRIKSLNEQLHISQSAFEKRFRKLVGATPKKFASIVRFNTVLQDIGKEKSLTEICYDNNFFDQAHFIKEFKQFTGDTPDNFRRLL
ncbi:MAG: helix-turn-helix domain-containing protein [Flavipsychrobacter sp.]|nr:helix-turn-helix domain-containing protein [Flavipsychrobacter sp.]